MGPVRHPGRGAGSLVSVSSPSVRSHVHARHAQSRNAEIGLLDSGLGGLSIVQALQRAMPAERLLYYADSAYCPYGERDEAFIRSRTLTIASELEQRGAKAIVIACNTACAAALEHVRSAVSVPVVGLEPAVKPAVALTRTGRIAVFATPRTIASRRLDILIERYATGIIVERIAAPDWVGFVERDQIASEDAFHAVERLVRPAIERGADVLVLGCTHFPFLTSLIRTAAGPGVAIVDSGDAIARRARHVLEELDLLASPDAEAQPLTVMTSTTTPAEIGERAAQMLGGDVRLA